MFNFNPFVVHFSQEYPVVIDNRQKFLYILCIGHPAYLCVPCQLPIESGMTIQDGGYSLGNHRELWAPSKNEESQIVLIDVFFFKGTTLPSSIVKQVSLG